MPGHSIKPTNGTPKTGPDAVNAIRERKTPTISEALKKVPQQLVKEKTVWAPQLVNPKNMNALPQKNKVV